jgi:metal-responsive CopG/Arc/MetJ family transcriptional regulator
MTICLYTVTRHIRVVTGVSELVRTTVKLPKELMKELKMFCVKNDRLLSEVIKEAIEEYLRRHTP